MRVFCVSDVHGNLSALKAVLSKVKFNADKDMLFILGDIIDWGTESVATLQYVYDLCKSSNNVKFIIGNHEMMMLSALRDRNYMALTCWMNNGGLETNQELNKLPFEKRKELILFLSNAYHSFRYHNYLFTHSSPPTDECSYEHSLMHSEFDPEIAYAVWRRVEPAQQKNRGFILVSGHTIANKYNGSNPVSVYIDKRNKYINIDCGAKLINKGYELKGRLALLEIKKFGYKITYSEE